MSILLTNLNIRKNHTWRKIQQFKDFPDGILLFTCILKEFLILYTSANSFIVSDVVFYLTILEKQSSHFISY